jgi:hypothetical protein
LIDRQAVKFFVTVVIEESIKGDLAVNPNPGMLLSP